MAELEQKPGTPTDAREVSERRPGSCARLSLRPAANLAMRSGGREQHGSARHRPRRGARCHNTYSDLTARRIHTQACTQANRSAHKAHCTPNASARLRCPSLWPALLPYLKAEADMSAQVEEGGRHVSAPGRLEKAAAGTSNVAKQRSAHVDPTLGYSLWPLQAASVCSVWFWPCPQPQVVIPVRHAPGKGATDPPKGWRRVVSACGKDTLAVLLGEILGMLHVLGAYGPATRSGWHGSTVDVPANLSCRPVDRTYYHLAGGSPSSIFGQHGGGQRWGWRVECSCWREIDVESSRKHGRIPLCF